MITIKSASQIEKMRQSCKLTKEVLELLEEHIKPGVNTKQLDKLVHDYYVSHGARPNFLHYNGYPASICASVNDEVVHGIPSKHRILREGDIISVDLGCTLDGWNSDAARTFGVGKISDEAQRLIDVTKQSFFEGIKFLKHGAKLGDVSSAIQKYVEGHGFGVVRDLVGHGIGREMHEDPSVPNFGKAGHGVKLAAGMALAIEPMVTAGDFRVSVLDDDWTVVTDDGSLAAHYENTVVVTKDGYEILTL